MLKIDYKFKDVSLRQKAMTHSSYANEHHGTHLDCNERLEFLGDAVLGFVTADYLFTHYPELPEGELTKMRAAVVCGVRCARSRGNSAFRRRFVWATARRTAAAESARPSWPMRLRRFWARSIWTAVSSRRARSCCASFRTR